MHLIWAHGWESKTRNKDQRTFFKANLANNIYMEQIKILKI